LRHQQTTLETGNKIPHMVEFEFLDETLDINSTPSYHLSIQANLDGLIFAILDTVRNKYIALKSYGLTEKPNHNTGFDWYESILQKDEFLLQDYKSVGLIYVGEKSTLVPDPLFNKESISDYTDLNIEIDDYEEVCFNKINRLDTWVLYPFPVKLGNVFQKQFPNISFFHQSVPFINQLMLNQKNGGSKPEVYINLYGSMFEMAVVTSANLKLYNCFPYKNVNDLLYFILNVFNQMKLPADQTKVFLSGKITKQSSLYENLKRYITKLNFGKPDSHFSYSYTFDNLPRHSNINLLNLYHCV